MHALIFAFNSVSSFFVCMQLKVHAPFHLAKVMHALTRSMIAQKMLLQSSARNL